MSILEPMVSTEKLYKTDNFIPLQRACERGERLYQVRLYEERPTFRSVRSGNLRMRMLLGFIEARAVVIDALMKTDENLQYLSVMCTSAAPPQIFSTILKSISPRIVLEELDRRRVEDSLSNSALHSLVPGAIPFARTFRTLNDSRKILVTLLLEYRALLAEYAPLLHTRSSVESLSASRSSSSLTAPFMIFEHNNQICGIPEFQIESISPGANGASLMQISRDQGSRVLVCSDVICIKEINLALCRMKNKNERGYYSASVPLPGGDFAFTLVIPSYL